MTAAPSKTLADFVATQKAAYLNAVEEGKATDWTVVMGNEAGDLDSLASAIAYAWYATEIQKSPTVSLIQTPRSDLHLRAENLHALSLAGFDVTEPAILCIDDIPPSSPFPSNRFALVDHNRLQPAFYLENPDARVVAIIDHHDDEGCHKDTADPRIIVTPTGSATSLVARLLEEKCPSAIPSELATLLLCGILIDTNGLKEGGKAEMTDRAAAAFLLSHSLLVSESGDSAGSGLQDHDQIQGLSAVLHSKKADVSHLGTRDLLRRDYKEYTMVPSWAPEKTILVGLCSVPVGLKSWISRDDAFWASTEQWAEDRKLSVLGILTSFRDEEKMNKHGKAKHRREQLFVVKEDGVEGLAERLFKGLKHSEELELKKRTFVEHYGVEEGVGFGPSFQAKVWQQGNTDATRKVTAPLVKDIIEGDSKGSNV
ncbi:hypothetical protein PHLCEN_2v8975 [Hermanssonia centrifuga]|uniref:DHHA2 domain-containing protein n=1 Tax=Hermanssonia centrifuga TaxID=98765 RepID=A0A2R6NS59_9APHY|nr:hypothetical protein PHLCEN_2v8975 [Hermanssonia centrifuga]